MAIKTDPQPRPGTPIGNRNFLSPIGFKFSLKRSPGVAYFCNEANIPDMSLSIAEQPTYLRNIPLPGDKIEVKNGKLYRNEKEINEPWIKEPIQYEMEAINVPEYSLWVLGDNRNNSLDSHVWGALSERNLIGTALARYWPLKKIGPIPVSYTHLTLPTKA